MGIDLVVDMHCQPKAYFGSGDAARGTAALVAMLKAKSRAEAIMQAASARGQDPRTASATVMVHGPSGVQQTEVTAAELFAQANPLNQAAAGCSGCPARLYDAPYGCTRYLDYPIPPAAEAWLMTVLEGRDRLGGVVCLAAIEDFGWDGAPIRDGYRARGLLAPQPALRDLGGGAVISSDSILQAMLCVGPLGAMHAVILLSWFGAVHLDGQPLSGNDKSALRPLLSLAPEARATRTRFVLPPPPQEAPHLALLLHAAYRAWLVDAQLLVDA